MIILTDKQKECIKKVTELYKNGKEIITIAGPAGSSKTTLVNYIIESIGLKPYEVDFCCYTGKASSVLRQKGIPAKTIHKTIYNCKRNPRTGKFYFRKKIYLDNLYCKLLVVDEISMVSNSLLEDLRSFNIPIICLGDPYQLPPILAEPNNLLDEPDILLTEIFRQKENSTILDLATQIREKRGIKSNFNDDAVRTVSNEELEVGMLNWADQVLCGTHKCRKAFNDAIRKSNGIDSLIPVVGDKIICLHNYWDIFSNYKNEPLVNGTIGIITKIKNINLESFNHYMDVEFRPTWDFEDAYDFRIDLNPFYGEKAYKNNYAMNHPRVSVDYGYAITVHKSQGSQWDKVLVYTPDAFGDKDKMLYTAVTRASKKLLYIQ